MSETSGRASLLPMTSHRGIGGTMSNTKLHPCAAPGCPHQTAYTWCSAVHSPREAERTHHRREPAKPSRAA